LQELADAVNRPQTAVFQARLYMSRELRTRKQKELALRQNQLDLYDDSLAMR
jgi:hypothetical protein